jgi:hypothetical protein
MVAVAENSRSSIKITPQRSKESSIVPKSTHSSLPEHLDRNNSISEQNEDSLKDLSL